MWAHSTTPAAIVHNIVFLPYVLISNLETDISFKKYLVLKKNAKIKFNCRI